LENISPCHMECETDIKRQLLNAEAITISQNTSVLIGSTVQKSMHRLRCAASESTLIDEIGFEYTH
jgi:hypothetical protein